MDHIAPSSEHDPAEGVLQDADAAATLSLSLPPHPLPLKFHLQNQDTGQNSFFNNVMIIPPESRSLPLIPSPHSDSYPTHPPPPPPPPRSVPLVGQPPSQPHSTTPLPPIPPPLPIAESGIGITQLDAMHPIPDLRTPPSHAVNTLKTCKNHPFCMDGITQR
ncbi:hypothetical protein NA56DRAFT_708561 [Hyaloscypha hepaticicola]|uniref:Uncharacterized protein n=1 Tax=Hyaloscypha hepaticicola TaxID=2082293 RepID=A0A2J6PRL3_9HELO|nr:hypothetical protein NA56DRAFT_708561 [Hyaloscypha hepaticicola]